MESKDYIDLNDLIPIAKLGDKLILLIAEEDADNPSAICVQANLETCNFTSAESIQGFLKFNPYEQVDWRDKNVRYMYHDIIYKKFSNKTIIEMIIDFTDKYEKSR